MAGLVKCVCRGKEPSRKEAVGSDSGMWRRLHGWALELGLGIMGRISTSRSGSTVQSMLGMGHSRGQDGGAPGT